MSKNLFNSIKLTKPKRNYFDLSHDVKLTMDMGQLIPTLCMECVPGDSFNISSESLVRFAPLIAPVMHRFDIYQHYFFVPNRILWDNWEKWIMQRDATIVAPTIGLNNSNTAVEPDGFPLVNYLLGLEPLASSIFTPVNALPFAAYQAIYNEYYRDQNLIEEIDYKLVDGNNTANITELLKKRYRAWQHDYFTASLPFAQRGAAVDIPIGIGQVKLAGDSATETVLDGTPFDALVPNSDSDYPDGIIPGSLYADIEPTTINELRRSFKLQEWLERNARAGVRYVEAILAHFGVRSSDARLQRPEYITGSKSPVMISEVLNTTGEDGGLPQGNMAGHAVGLTSGHNGNYFCEEHGFIIGIMSVLPRSAYMQGLPRWAFKNEDAFDYFWPSFAHIGEQEVKNREIFFADSSNAERALTFGYVPRYAEYKYMPSRVCGNFITDLAYWHMARKFDALPALNQDFVECKPGKRIFAVTAESTNSLFVQILHKIGAKRPMPKFGTPSF